MNIITANDNDEIDKEPARILIIDSYYISLYFSFISQSLTLANRLSITILAGYSSISSLS